ncbi:26S proteasome regulatory subunit RPN6 [Kluyveromyces marxianus]|uniref:26S proteasome regulatory subunit RPN6 n=2 Tax=Kluyveromyces marxianus TaxID=4911 RepID=W0TAI2_KLUMD|nr:26S proteasome regulatory subunit RPN6 [Kluyveromyces marxianus DMKU3-1042]QGN14842.1 26S proteasome regulatory subunit RPN6 [Kluyveromyces marxianus]BAO39114.1 26S proteasome regulatory subunit RPN6 [Kluyveromyces marxianus DMKU3-1042]BAP70632.1 26S proteasome regulatory subunit RPN6 [Kluyveromyces marxianus]
MTLEEGRKYLAKKDYEKAEAQFLALLATESAADGPVNTKEAQEKEQAILELGTIYGTTGQSQKLADLVPRSRDMMMKLAKSKIAKVLRALLDDFDMIPDSLDTQIKICQDSIDFASKEKRIFLKHSLSIRLATLYYQKTHYNESLQLINDLLRQFKKLDDKTSLLEVHLLECKVYHKLRNMAKSKASLTSARTSANSIYCPTLTMAELDLMSGILHCEDKDYKTAYSYFFESFEAFHSQTGPNTFDKACQVLKYMLLSKIMLNLIDDVKTILNAKYTKETYQSRGIDAMKAVAEAYNNRSLLEFNTAMTTYKEELMGDELIRSHFNALYDTLLESNLCKIIEPFECVEVSHISKIIGLDAQQVEGKLSQMILDKVFYGVLDQGNGWLYIYDTPQQDATYDSSLELINQLNGVVEQLFEKAAVLY